MSLPTRPHASSMPMRLDARRLWILLTLASAAALAVVLVASPGEPVVVIASGGPRLQARAARDEVGFAVAPVLSPESTFQVYQVIAGWLAREMDQPVRLTQRRTYEQVNQLLGEGTLDFAIVCTGAYLSAVHSGIALKPLLIPIEAEGPVYHSHIVVRADSEHRTFAEAARGRIALADPLSLTGRYYPLALGIEAGIPPAEIEGRAFYTYSHHDSIHAVLDGIADVAAVDSLVYRFEMEHKPELADRLRVIDTSPPLGIQPVVAGPHVDEETAARFREALLSIGDTYEERRLLAEIDVGGFTVPPPGLWDGAERIVRMVDEAAR